MARKLADHNALKTVAAVGIFVIMILGGTFTAVYRFVNPVYRTEAVLQLTPPAGVTDQALPAWFERQATILRSDEELQQVCWQALCAENYALQDTREEFSHSLPGNLRVQADPAARTVSLQYAGVAADGVTQVCNGLAATYADAVHSKGQDPKVSALTADVPAQVNVAKANVPRKPEIDRRMPLALGVTATLLFVSLMAVMLLRRRIQRQLREIDRMADEDDLAALKDDMPLTA